MSFTTLHFFLFLAMGVLIYYLLPKKLQWVWLLVLSYLYYFTFSIKTSVFLIFTTVVTYTGGILLTRMNESSKAYLAANKETLDRAAKKAYKEKVKKNKRRVVVAMLLLCFGLLGVVKYLNFVIENIDALVLAVGHGQYFEPVNIILPLGISFYTFQSISFIRENTALKRIFLNMRCLYLFSHSCYRVRSAVLTGWRTSFMKGVLFR